MKWWRRRKEKKRAALWINVTVQYRTHDGWRTLTQERYHTYADPFGRYGVHDCPVGDGLRVLLTMNEQEQRPEMEGRFLHYG